MTGRSDPATILFLSPSPGWSGAEECLYWMATGLDRCRFRPVVALPAPGILSRRLRHAGLETRISGLGPWWAGPPANDPEALRRFAGGLAGRVAALETLIREEDAAVVCTNAVVIIEGALAARRLGRPHVWHLLDRIGVTPDLAMCLPPSRVCAIVDRLSARVVSVSDSVQASLLAHGGGQRAEVIRTGVPELPVRTAPAAKRRALGLRPDDPVICCTGRLSAAKGMQDLVRAAPQVLQAHPRAKFVLAGPDGGLQEQVRREIHRDRIAGAFRFLGFRADVWEIVACSDVLVLPSLSDSLPLTVLEAMRLGKPVVATRSGGAAELVVDGETGLLTPVGDPPALGRALVTLLGDKARCLEMGAHARQRATTVFSYGEHMRRFSQLLERVLSGEYHLKAEAAGALAELEQELAAAALARAAELVRERGGESAARPRGLRHFLRRVRGRLLRQPDPAGAWFAKAIFGLENVFAPAPARAGEKG